MYWVVLITLIIVIVAWHLYSYRSVAEPKSTRFNQDYIVGLNYLLNDQTDKALEHFINLLTVDSETVATHLTLGGLFRQRGEVDRAIRIHENLIARPQLTKEQRVAALIALGRDYMSAGLLDRAEVFFNEVFQHQHQHPEALRLLLDIHQQSRNWEQAIDTANRLQRLGNQDMKVPLAHYYCELADAQIKAGEARGAQRYLKKALATDVKCVRAMLMLAEQAQAAGATRRALNYFQGIIEKDPTYTSEVLAKVIACYQQLNWTKALMSYLADLAAKTKQLHVALAYAKLLHQLDSPTAARAFLTEFLHNAPSLSALHQLLAWQLQELSAEGRAGFEAISAYMEKLLEKRAGYRCGTCGFELNHLQWHCPSCRRWASIIAVE